MHEGGCGYPFFVSRGILEFKTQIAPKCNLGLPPKF